MSPLVVMIKPASGMCNMKCDYCFYCDEMEKRRQASYGFMTEDTLKNIIRKTLTGAKESVYYIFQGGEPTLRGIAFFEKFIEYEKQYNKNHVPVFHSIQTNGYCINEEWCAFLARNGFLAGLSVDGVRQTHDLHRHDQNGGGTFKAVLRAARLFDRYGVEYNILTVVTEAVAQNVEAVYSFYKKMGWKYQQYIACMEPAGADGGGADGGSANGGGGCALSAPLYGQFLVRLFRLWYSDWEKGEQVYIRQFENYIQKLMGMVPEACAHAGVCSRQYAVEADGSVYPCDFYMLDEYCLGNFNRDRLPALEEKRKEILFLKESEKISETCLSCKYFSLCRSGCRRNRRREEETDTYINRFCRGFRLFFDNCTEDMIKISEELQKAAKR